MAESEVPLYQVGGGKEELITRLRVTPEAGISQPSPNTAGGEEMVEKGERGGGEREGGEREMAGEEREMGREDREMAQRFEGYNQPVVGAIPGQAKSGQPHARVAVEAEVGDPHTLNSKL